MTNAEKPTKDLPRNLSVTKPDAAAEAREQAEAYDSIFADTPLVLDDGTILSIPPHPSYNMLDDDRLEEYEEYLFEIDTEYEREDDIFIPEQHLKGADGNDSGVTLPSSIQRGALKGPPYRRVVDGKSVLVKPPHTVRVVQIALGEKGYELLRAGGRSAKDVNKIWTEQSLKIQERQQRDSKSKAGPVDLETVPQTDSQ